MITRKKYWQEYREELAQISSIQNIIKKNNKTFEWKKEQILNNIPNHEDIYQEMENEIFVLNEDYEYNNDFNEFSGLKINDAINATSDLKKQLQDILFKKTEDKDFLKKVQEVILNKNISKIQNILNEEYQNISKRGNNEKTKN